MPTYLDFESSRDGRTIPDIKKGFRDFLIAKTLKSPEGPQTFNQYFYTYKETSDYPNLDPGTVIEYITDSGVRTREDDLTQAKNNNAFSPEDYDVIENLNQFKSRELGTVESYVTDSGTRTRKIDLDAHKRLNTFKPSEDFFIIEDLNTYARKANLNLYPYFVQSNHNLIGIMTYDNYETESELMKFAAYNIKSNRQGPVFSRIAQNLETATVGKARFIDALEGNIGTAINIVTGKEPLIEYNNKITVASSLLGKGVDFLQTVAGIEFPISEIPGDYLTNPKNPIENRPEPRTEVGRILQDVTGALGSLVGIQRRPKLSRKPSDLFIEYMGQGPKQTLFDLLSYSTYAPNYTATARSQQSSKTFNFINNIGASVNKLLGLEAPAGKAYIGDDRGNDVQYAMSDFNDRPVRSPFYLSLMFDSVQTILFQRDNGQTIGGKLTWTSKNSRNQLGANNNSYGDQRGNLEDSLSNKFEFRGDSILGYTQELLNTMPTDGGEARSHVANVIDQTSRIFREGDVYLSRGSAVKYVDKNGKENGVEYCRTWTKDRPYITYDDTMRKGMNIRKFEGSVMTDPWNLNIAPMSINKSFEGSSNIFKGGPADLDGQTWYAKKYMFSIENLAWKTSNRPGYTVLDLPYCERGPNGGRIMWFPPYDLQINESSQAKWEENTFLGRPEPIYTYQNTTRGGQLSFKIIVDHPSILNLLVREEFKDLSDEEAEEYIDAFFAGCKDIDFYELIRKHSKLTPSDLELVLLWLDDYAKGKGDPNGTKKFKKTLKPRVIENPGVQEEPIKTPITVPGDPQPVSITTRLNFENDWPKPEKGTESSETYDQVYQKYLTVRNEYVKNLQTWTPVLLNANNPQANLDVEKLIGSKRPKESVSVVTTKQVALLNKYFDELTTRYQKYNGEINTLKQDISGKTVQNIKVVITSSTSALTTQEYNRKLSLRRSHSLVKDLFQKISKDGTTPKIDWIKEETFKNKPVTEIVSTENTFNLKDFGWGEDYTGTIQIITKNYGEESTGDTANQLETNCVNKVFPSLPIMSIVAPITFYCRAVDINIDYQKLTTKIEEQEDPRTPKPRTRVIWDEIPEEIPPPPNKPTIDALKVIIMKTLAECYYFEMLEKKSPLVFKSLKDKLKYFHPAFHSMTPEGLNSRLTFLQQCIRPGDTIPIKGIADDRDLTARNTTFGPPPICILRIGDFYNSKIVIRDINIKFDDRLWDMNPEGIGIQPMIADVSLQVSFIGGQGLEKPIETLQNALSSNFYANTEIYDPRAESTNKIIGGQDAAEFTKDRLTELMEDAKNREVESKNQENQKISKGEYIAKPDGELTLNLTELVTDVITKVDEYYSTYETAYDSFNTMYGPIITSLMFDPKYRDVKTYEVFNSSVPTSTNIDLMGIPKKGFEIEMRLQKFKDLFIEKVSNSGTSISTIFEFNKELTPEKVIKSDDLIREKIIQITEKKFTDILDKHTKDIKGDMETRRDNLISTLDKVNFLVKFGFDAKIITEGGDSEQATLSGFTSSNFYDEYSRYVDYIKENTPKMYEPINTTFDFSYMDINDTVITSILSVWLKDEIDNIISLYKADVSGQFTTKVISELQKRLNKFISTPKTTKFKFGKIKPRKSDKQIKYTYTASTLTNNTAKDELKLLKSSNVPVTNNKLNYYKPKKQ